MSAARASLTGDHEADVAVLGAGLAGLATALALARPGRRLVVLEAGSLDGPPGIDLGHVGTGLSEPYTEAIARYGHEEARSLWEHHREGHERLREVLAELGQDCGYRRDGGFVLARDRAEAEALADSEDALRDDGFSGEFLDHYMLEARFDVRGFTGAYWAADDAEVEPVDLRRALAGAAAARGVSLFEGSAVLGLQADASGVIAETAHGRLRASQGVLAAGSGALALLPGLGGSLTRVEARGLLGARPPDGPVPSPARAADGSFAWRQARGLHVAAFGALAAACAGDGDAIGSGLSRVLATHLGEVPSPLAIAPGSVLSGVDGLPLVGPLPNLPLVAALGMGALGPAWAFRCAGWAAEALAGGGDPAPPLLRASRFPVSG